MPPELVNKEVINKGESEAAKKTPTPTEENVFPVESNHLPKDVPAAGGEAGGGGEQAKKIRITDRPHAQTPRELLLSMREFYKDYPLEWSDGVLALACGSRYSFEKRAEITNDWCCYAIKNNQGGNTFSMLNADLQKWFRNQKNVDRWNEPKGGTVSQTQTPTYQAPAPPRAVQTIYK